MCEQETKTPYWRCEREGTVTEVFDVGVALALLLLDEVVFPHDVSMGSGRITIALSVEGQSTYSDAENLNYSEVQSLYNLWKENNEYGPIIWICKKRKYVSSEHEARLRSAGLWNDELDALTIG
jgi:hypothetical protein